MVSQNLDQYCVKHKCFLVGGRDMNAKYTEMCLYEKTLMPIRGMRNKLCYHKVLSPEVLIFGTYN